MTTDTVKIDTREIEARSLREKIYGPITDKSWEAVAHRWIADLPWLRTHASKGIKT